MIQFQLGTSDSRKTNTYVKTIYVIRRYFNEDRMVGRHSVARSNQRFEADRKLDTRATVEAVRQLMMSLVSCNGFVLPWLNRTPGQNRYEEQQVDLVSSYRLTSGGDVGTPVPTLTCTITGDDLLLSHFLAFKSSRNASSKFPGVYFATLTM